MGGGARGKRKHLNSFANSKKPKNSSSHITLHIDSNSKLSSSTDSFILNPSPVLYGGARGDNFAVKLPERSQTGFEKLADQRLTSSFLGQDCHSCPIMGDTHGIQDRRVFVLGDQFLPWRLGEGADCVPVMRIEDANFELLKQALMAQRGHGFCPYEGSIFCVGLLSHICRVGSKKFWDDFLSFQGWAKANFSVSVFPFIPPFPKDFPKECLSAIHNVFIGIASRYEGDFHGRKDTDFCLWLPLDRMMNQIGASKIPMRSEHFYIKGANGDHDKFIIGPDMGWEGFSTAFREHLPQDIEKLFWALVFKEILRVAPISLGVELPSDISLAAGLVRCAATTPPASAGAVRTVHILGHSMAREVESVLKVLGRNAVDKYNVSYHCLRPKPWEDENFTVPQQKHKDDVLIFVGMGNCLFKKSRPVPIPGKMHLERPGYLDDQGALEFLEGMAGVLRVASAKFSGTVYWAGPFPRHLEKCCNDPEHAFPKSTVFRSNLHYLDLWNPFLHLHPRIRVRGNVAFLPFYQILGERFYNKWTRDGVHLIGPINESFARALAALPPKPSPLPPPLPSGDLSFTTWSLLQPVLRPAAVTSPPVITLPATPPRNTVSTAATTTTASTTTTTTTTTATTAPITTTSSATTTTTTAGSSRQTGIVLPSFSITPATPAQSPAQQQATRPTGSVPPHISTITVAERNAILARAGLVSPDRNMETN